MLGKLTDSEFNLIRNSLKKDKTIVIRLNEYKETMHIKCMCEDLYYCTYAHEVGSPIRFIKYLETYRMTIDMLQKSVNDFLEKTSVRYSIVEV